MGETLAHPGQTANPWALLSKRSDKDDWERVVQIQFDDDKLMVRSKADGHIFHGEMLHAVAPGKSLDRTERKKRPDSSPTDSKRRQKDQWPPFLLSRKNAKHIDGTWGMQLFPDSLDTRSVSEVAGSDHNFTDRAIPDKTIASCFNNRILYRITDSGTSANLIALADASRIGTTLYGVGSYGGYMGKLNYLSTLPDCTNYGASVHDPAIGDHLLALPYTTKDIVDTKDTREFENECIKAFQIKLAGLQLRSIPCTAVFFEIVLSGNGMRLSQRFCKRFAAICEASKIAMVIDECMTAGRCSFSDNSCLLCDFYELKPLFVTVGKQFGAGADCYVPLAHVL